MSKESDLAYKEFHDNFHGRGCNLDCKSTWDAALAWCRPLAIAAIRKAKAAKKRQPKAPRESVSFTPPSLEELTTYMKSQGFSDSMETAESFIAYYETRGWVPSGSRSRMRSWKAAVRTWKRNAFPVNRMNGSEQGEESPVSPAERQRRKKVSEALLQRYQRENDIRLGLIPVSGGN